MYFMLLLIVICVVRRSWAPVEGRHSNIWWWWWWWHVSASQYQKGQKTVYRNKTIGSRASIHKFCRCGSASRISAFFSSWK